MKLTVNGYTVTRAGITVATIIWSGGRIAKVRSPNGTVIGRLLAQGDGTYCAFTALSQSEWTPSDTEITGPVTLDAAVAAILERKPDASPER